MMLNKKYLLIVLGGIFSTIAFFPSVSSAENINSFHVNARIHADGLVSVSERIGYNFGSLVRHGMFRTIPLTSQDGPRIVITLDSIHDEYGQPYRYSDESSAYSAKWKIGDPNSTISGVKTYSINYDVSNVIRRFDDHDEWYWNVTGNEWEIPITASDITIELPEGVSVESTQAVCFLGAFGSRERECTVESDAAGLHISSPRLLSPGEGMTIAVSMPPGSVTGYAVDLPEPAKDNPGATGEFLSFFDSFWFNGVFLLFIIALIIFSFLRRNKVKIVIPRKLKAMPVVVSYEPPEVLMPPDIGTLIDRSMDPGDMTPVIIDLAVKGYIKINYKTTPAAFGLTSKSYEFIKLKSGADLTHPAYVRTYQVLFGKENIAPPPPAKKAWWGFLISSPVSRESVTLSKLSRESTRIPSIYKSLQSEMWDHLKSKGYLKGSLRATAVWQSAFYMAAALFLFIAYLSSSNYLVIAGIVFIFIVPFTRGPEQLSEKGIEAFKKILGFREYLAMVEADRLRLLNAPALQPETFEKYLPYAMIFKVEKEWAQKFEALPLVQPQWLEGSIGTFSAVLFADSLSSMNSSFSSAFSSASSSGGGGSSGGGSGGGGGGSW